MKLLYLLLLLATELLYSQNLFYGELVNSQTGKSIPYGHLFIKKNNGFTADEEGRFNTTQEKLKLNVKITALGYENKNTVLYSGKKNTVFLTPKVENLDEVILDFKDPAKELIRKIVDAIPINYPVKEEQLNGILSENAYRDSLSLEPIYKVETEIKADKASYAKKTNFGNIQLLKFKIDSIDLDSINLKIYGGAHLAHSGDIVHARKGPLNVKKLNNYQFKIKDTIAYEDKSVIKIDYQNAKTSGSLFVEEHSFAVVKVIRKVNPNEIDDRNILKLHQRLFWLQTTTYEIGEDQKWRLDSVNYRTAFVWKKKRRHFYLQIKFKVLGHDTQIKPISQNQRFDYGSILSDYIIIQNSKTANTKINFNQKLFSSLRKLKIPMGISFYKFSNFPHSLEFDPLKLDINSNKSQKWFSVLKVDYEYELNNKFGLRYNISQSFKKNVFRSHSLGINYYQDLSKQRQLFLKSSVNYGKRLTSIPQGVYNFKSSFSFGNKEFDSGKVALYSQSRENFFEPSVGVIFRLNSTLYLELESSFYLPLSYSHGIFAQEKNEFWFWNRKKEFRETDIKLLNNNKIIENKYHLGINLYFQL